MNVAGLSIAVVAPAGQPGARAVQAGLEHAGTTGLFPTERVLTEAVGLGFRPDVIVRPGPDGIDHEAGSSSGEQPPPADRQPCVVFLSSGTTGRPKLVERSVESIWAEADRYVAGGCIASTDRVVIGVPLYHAYGIGVLAACLRSGAAYEVIDPSALGRLGGLLRDWATVGAIVPATARLLAARCRRPGEATGLRTVMAGAGAVGERLACDFEAAFGLPLGRNYGSTETGAVAWTAGRVPPFVVGDPFPTVRLGLRDDDGSEIVQPDRPGRVVVQLGNEAELPMGDLGAWTEPGGQLAIVGRVHDTPRRNGRYVPTALVEEVAREVAGVASAKARCVDDDLRLEVLSSDPVDVASIRRAIRREVGDWAVPSAVDVRPPTARAVDGKVPASPCYAIDPAVLASVTGAGRIAAVIGALAETGALAQLDGRKPVAGIATDLGLDSGALHGVLAMLEHSGVVVSGAGDGGNGPVQSLSEGQWAVIDLEMSILRGPNSTRALSDLLQEGRPMETWTSEFSAIYQRATTSSPVLCRSVLRRAGVAGFDRLVVLSTEPAPWAAQAAELAPGLDIELIAIAPGTGGAPFPDPGDRHCSGSTIVVVQNTIHYRSVGRWLVELPDGGRQRLVIVDVFVRPDGENGPLALDWVTHGEAERPTREDTDAWLVGLGWSPGRRFELGPLDTVILDRGVDDA